MELDYRPYDHPRDRHEVTRVWRECGWIDEGEEAGVELFAAATNGLVGLVRDVPECHVTTVPGTIQHLGSDLSLLAVTSVTTGRVARKQGIAGRLTAESVARGADAGAQVAGLGMFEQGFYNRLGFGTASYEHLVTFDPASLKVSGRPAPPHRLTEDNWPAMHDNRLTRMRWHGACSLTSGAITRVDVMFTKNGFGLGYFDKDTGALTHHLWGRARGENGPYSIYWLAYETHEQLLDLLRLLKGLGDQVRSIWMVEPPGMYIQDFLEYPFRFRQLTKKGEMEHKMAGEAFSQLRILDLPGCLEQTSIPNCPPIRFNLKLSDPIENLLDDRKGFRGIGGEYVVQLGEESYARDGYEDGLPLLDATVGAFTRLWMGVLPASGLALTADLSGPHELLATLDDGVRLPIPHFDWMY